MRLMCKGTSVHIRAGKLPVDLLFHISHLLNLRADGWAAIIHYFVTNKWYAHSANLWHYY